MPRTPCEIRADRVISKTGTDCTQNFMAGAFLALQYARFYGAGFAILKEKSPSCGVGQVYDGTFSKTLIRGEGLFARMLRENNFFVCTEQDSILEKFLTRFSCDYE